MAKRKRSHRRKSMTIPLGPILGLAAGFRDPLQQVMSGNYLSAIDWASMNYTGYNPNDKTWNPLRLQWGLMPLIIGLLEHKFVGGRPLNLNRTLAAAGVPFIRL